MPASPASLCRSGLRDADPAHAAVLLQQRDPGAAVAAPALQGHHGLAERQIARPAALPFQVEHAQRAPVLRTMRSGARSDTTPARDGVATAAPPGEPGRASRCGGEHVSPGDGFRRGMAGRVLHELAKGQAADQASPAYSPRAG